MTALAEDARVRIRKDAGPDDGLDVEAWNAANPLHPRSGDGRFRDRLASALRELAHLGEVLSHDEFGEPDHPFSDHGAVLVHEGGTITIAKIAEDGQPTVIADNLTWDDVSELRDSLDAVTTDLEADIEPGSHFSVDDEDAGELESLVRHGVMPNGQKYVSIDSRDGQDDIQLTHEHAADLLTTLESASDTQRDAKEGDPTITRALPAGEHLERRKVLGDKYADHVMIAGLVSTLDGPHVRLGLIGPNEGEGVRRWTGGRGKTTIDLDEEYAAKLAEIVEEFDRRGKVRQKINDKAVNAAKAAEDADQDPDWDEVDAEIRRQLEEVDDAPLPGQERFAPWESDYDVQNLETPWGTIRLTDVGMDDEDNGHFRHIRAEIWPASMSEEEYDTGATPTGGPDWAWPGTRWQKSTADLLPKDVKALIKLLRESYTPEARAELSKSAGGTARRADNDRIAREGRKYWTRSPEGLGKWARSAHPWTKLYRHLVTKMDPETARRLTSSYFKAVFGYAPSARQGKNPVGKG